MKKIMVVGAGQWQVPAIKKARDMGFFVIATDRNPDSPGFAVAHSYKAIDISDLEGTLAFARENSITGIMTVGVDLSVPTVAYVSEKMGLIGPSFASVINCANKLYVRDKLAALGLSSVSCFPIRDMREISDVAKRVQWPVVIKPADSSGSKGVMLASNLEQMTVAVENAMVRTRSGVVICEQFLEGQEVSVEGLVFSGKVLIAAITEKIAPPLPYFVELGHFIPSTLTERQKEKVKLFISDIISALGLDYIPFHIEVMVSGDKISLVEVGARLGGGTITSDLVPLATGIDLLAEVIKMSVNLEPDLTPKFIRAAADRFFVTSEGILEKIEGVEEAKKVPGIRKVFFKVKEKDRLCNLKSSEDRIGYVIGSGNTREEALTACEEALKKIRIHLSPCS